MTTISPAITLSRSALTRNLQHAKESFAPEGVLMMAVKSNAYGHGDERVVPLALQSGVDELAVLDIDTALRIRPLAPSAPLFAWLLSPHDDFAAAAAEHIELGVSALWQLEAIAQSGAAEPLTVHLKIDTGLHRNGATEEQWPALVARARELSNAGIITVRAVWSHLADTSIETSRASLAKLSSAVNVAREAGLNPTVIHLAASHAAVELPETRLDLVRLGILAYGVSPFDDHTAQELGFHPVLTLHAPVVATEKEHVILGVGWKHGLLHPIEPASITVGGGRFTLVDMAAESSTWRAEAHTSLPEPGTLVAIIGAESDVSVEQWAMWCHTIGDEVLAKLSPALPRTLVD
jgi:alanine racemase